MIWFRVNNVIIDLSQFKRFCLDSDGATNSHKIYGESNSSRSLNLQLITEVKERNDGQNLLDGMWDAILTHYPDSCTFKWNRTIDEELEMNEKARDYHTEGECIAIGRECRVQGWETWPRFIVRERMTSFGVSWSNQAFWAHNIT